MDHIQYLMTMLERTIAQRPLVTATTSSAAVLVAFAAWCIQDYCDYPALGPGGPPHNVRGWAWITFGIRPFALNPTYLMIYGPHDEKEMKILRPIMQKSIPFMTSHSKVEKGRWKELI
ncbi:hypothetical protein FSST1_012531 [Fusarium sambucinum]